VLGLNVSPVTTGGLTVIFAPIVLVPALRKTVVATATGLVAIVNVPVVLPPAIAQLAAVTAVLLLPMTTVHPLAGAGD